MSYLALLMCLNLLGTAVVVVVAFPTPFIGLVKKKDSFLLLQRSISSTTTIATPTTRNPFLRRSRPSSTTGVITATTTTTTNNNNVILYKMRKDDDDEDSFPDPHALMEYLDGDSINSYLDNDDNDGSSSSSSTSSSSKSTFVSFEEFLELQRKQQYLRSCPIFRGCTDNDLSRIATKMVSQKVNPDEKLVVQGDKKGDSMYFLKSGTFQAIGEQQQSKSQQSQSPASAAAAAAAISNNDNGTSTTTTTTTTVIYKTYSKEGDFFAELALLFDQPRAATIVCSSSDGGEVYRLNKNSFLDALHTNSAVYETARRLVLAKYKSKRIRDILPKIRIDELLALIKARLLLLTSGSSSSSSSTSRIRTRFTSLRTYSLGACATLIMTQYVQTKAVRAVVFAMWLLAHLL